MYKRQDIRRTIETTPGRYMVVDLLPRHPKLQPEICNVVLTKKEIAKLIGEVYRYCGQKATVIFADQMMKLGFTKAFNAGISFGMADMVVPAKKVELVEAAKKEVSEFENQ